MIAGRMRTLGIIGGIAPESTIDYYRQIITGYRARTGGAYPRILINSIDLTGMLALMDRPPELVALLVGEVEKLARAGAEIALMASNTPHAVYDEVAAAAPIPMLSIVDAARDAAKALGLTRVGLFGTRFTMQGRVYPSVFSRAGITVLAPDDAEQQFIHDKYMSELVNGQFHDETRRAVLKIAAEMKRRHAIDGLLLAGTELPLLLRDVGGLGVVLLDTTSIHAGRAVEAMVR